MPRMSLWTRERTQTVVKLAGDLARRPRLARELPVWLRHRNRTTMELRRPWWPYRAAEAVAAALPPGGRVFEFGGGGSTLWLHDLGATLTTVEHHKGWYEELRSLLPDDVTLILREPTSDGTASSESEPGFFDDYVATIAEVADDSLDLVIVDGRARVACGTAAMDKVKPGGMLLLDDSDRPRYAQLVERLAAWPRTVHRGLKPGGGATFETSVWRRPA